MGISNKGFLIVWIHNKGILIVRIHNKRFFIFGIHNETPGATRSHQEPPGATRSHQEPPLIVDPNNKDSLMLDPHKKVSLIVDPYNKESLVGLPCCVLTIRIPFLWIHITRNPLLLMPTIRKPLLWIWCGVCAGFMVIGCHGVRVRVCACVCVCVCVCARAPWCAHIAHFLCILFHCGAPSFCLSLHYNSASALCILCTLFSELTGCVVVGMHCIHFTCSSLLLIFLSMFNSYLNIYIQALSHIC